MKKGLFCNAIASGLFLTAATAAFSQTLTFNTLAGYAGRISADGTASSSRFYNPNAVAVDNAGNLYVADTGNHTIRKITPAGITSTLAGLPGVSGSANGSGSGARFSQPQGLVADNAGNVFVADTGNHAIRMITSGGVVSTLAGSAGSSGTNDGPASTARFYAPQGVAVDNPGNVYVADTWNHTIRKITPGGVVSTLAGSAGNFGTTDATGSSARFYQPQSVAVDGSGTLLVADTANHTIRKITSGGAVSTLAGSAGNFGSVDATGSNARFYEPRGIALDTGGNVFVTDTANQTLRRITPGGAVSTLAGSAGNYGSADGTGSSARFWAPQGVAVLGATSIFVADTANSTIRKVTSAGTVTTLAGSASIGGADGAGSNARFFWPAGAAVDSAGNLYVADTENGTIRKVTPSGWVSTLAGSAGIYGSADGAGASAQFYGPQGVAVDTAGNVYVADTANGTIRKIVAGGAVSTLAGSAGSFGGLDGTNATALFYQPQGVAVDSHGNVLVADTWNHTIRRITPAGVVSTLAGSVGNFGGADGTNSKARFCWPANLAVDGAGNVFVSDFFNHTIRKVAPAGTNWVVSTVAGAAGLWGSTDGTNRTARFFQPQGISIDSSGNLYVVDSGNHTIRKVAPAGTNWVVSTVAGQTGVSGAAGGTGTGAQFDYPAAIALNAAGLSYVADSANNTIRQGSRAINGAPAIIAQPQSQTVDPGSSVTFSVTATGLSPLSYQWRSNGTNLAGATDSSCTRANVQSADVGNYSVSVANSVGNVSSADALLVINGAPMILVQPQDQTALLGQSATFSVVAVGTQPLAYQWRFEGNIIPGATVSSFSLVSIQGTNTGAYSVVVANSSGAIASSAARLGVMALSSWGDNSSGQLDLPPDAVDVVAVACGAWHNLALRADGTVVPWGDNSSGQCEVPPTLADVVAIAAGGYHNLAIVADGTVSSWGANDNGQTNVPAALAHVMAVSAGAWHSLALRTDGTVVAWGDNTSGQTNVPPGLTNVVAIAAGGNHCLALRADDTVVAWGENTDAQGNFVGQSLVPSGLTNVTSVAAGDYHSLAFQANGTVVAWGDNSQGQCDVPVALSNVVALAGGGAHSLALKSDGTVAAWGANWNGQCDPPPTSTDVVGLSAGEYHSLALVMSSLPLPRLLQPAVRAGSFSALVQTLNRMDYAFESANSLTSTWNALSTNAGNGALKLLSDPAAAPQRFYRTRQF